MYLSTTHTMTPAEPTHPEFIHPDSNFAYIKTSRQINPVCRPQIRLIKSKVREDRKFG